MEDKRKFSADAGECPCCCHDSGAEASVAKKSDGEEVNKTVCSCDNVPQAADCCKHTGQHSCCHEEEKHHEESRCCCSDGGEPHKKTVGDDDVQTYGSCCSGGGKAHKKSKTEVGEVQTYGSCCSAKPEKHGKNQECEHYGDECCACGVDHKNNASYGGCACCDLTPDYSKKASKRKIDNETVKQIVFLSVSLVFLVLAFFDWHDISGGSGALMALYYVSPAWVSVILCGTPIFVGAVKSLKRKKLTASVLISVAMIASISLEIVGFFVPLGAEHGHGNLFAAGEIAFLMALGGLLEDLTVKKCRSGIQRLVGLIPTEANVITADGVQRVGLDKISVGDKVLVKSGEMVAVDGNVVKGSASIDQSSLTGEYLPVEVSEGGSVFGGTMNKNGVIEVEVTKLKNDMTIAKMAELTIEAEGKKAPVSRLADRWAGYIVPMVFATSIIVGLVCGFATDIGAIPSLVRAITVLVVFCPCSLVLATPTAIAAGLGNSAKHGVLVKSGGSIEQLARVDTVCFDKTGTLTEGKIKLEDVIPSNISKEELLKLAASVEKYSEHPLAVAVTDDASELYDAGDVTVTQGVGISATVEGKRIEIISFKKAVESGVVLGGLSVGADDAFKVGKTVTGVLSDGAAAGILTFSDTIRPNAAAVMAELKERGIKTVMLTGDNARSAEYIAGKCGVSEVMCNLMPEEKLGAIEKLQCEGHKVAMIGDGINDAPSLKLADCSFAMGAMGSDIAIDTADMAILNSDLEKAVDTMRLSKRVMRTIKFNIALAMTISVLAVVFSALGWLIPATGALVHNCTSVLVVSSSALLLYSRKKKLEA